MIFTVTATRDVSTAADAVWKAWTDPDMRVRYETPDGSGMRYLGFDTREGGTEIVAIEAGGEEVGRMISEIRTMRPPSDGAPGLLVVQGRGVFGGATGLLTQTTTTVEATDAGARLSGTSQIVAPGGQPTEAQVRDGWEAMLDRFTAILEETT